MGSILGNTKVKNGIREISRRTENEGPENACESFYDCNIIAHLKNKNHQIIQGRRGTGKTHILYVLKHDMEEHDRHCIYFDCNATGSIANISNTYYTEKYRAIQLIRDFMYHILGELHTYFTPLFQSENSNRTKNLSYLLDQFQEECNQCNMVVEAEMREMQRNTNVRNVNNTKLSLNIMEMLSPKSSSFETGFSSETQFEKGTTGKRNSTGTLYEEVIFPNVHKCLDGIARLSQKSFVLLIDEWSKIPL